MSESSVGVSGMVVTSPAIESTQMPASHFDERPRDIVNMQMHEEYQNLQTSI